MPKSIEYDFHTHHGLTLQKERYITKGLSGLINLGNTCFVNSILQCLSNTLKLTDYFLSSQWLYDDIEKMNPKKQVYPFLQVFSNFLINVWEYNQLLKPKSMIDSLGQYIPKYKELQQQDSHECLLNVLDLLHKGLSYPINVEISGQVVTTADQLMKESYEQWSSFHEKEYSYIVQCFGGMTYSKINCTKCEFKENKFEPFNCLSLEIGTSSLEENLQRHFQDEELVSEWKCEACKGTGCIKNTKLWSLPNYMIIHLKRFTNNGSKITSDIKYPLDDFNLTRWISPDKEDPNKYIYSLYGVNYHSGTSNSGHYWSACKNLDNGWYLFNDGNVSKYNITNDCMSSKEAYILFYSRKFIPNVGIKFN